MSGGATTAPASGQWVGRAVIISMLVFAAVAGGALYYLQGFHYYQRVAGLASIEIGGQSFAVSGYEGLDNPVLPLRLRGCFRLDDPDGALSAGGEAASPAPFAAPFWFECWDPAALDADLQAGRAQAVLAEIAGEGDFETQRIVVIYPDGRAYQWRRLSKDVR